MKTCPPPVIFFTSTAPQGDQSGTHPGNQVGAHNRLNTGDGNHRRGLSVELVTDQHLRESPATGDHSGHGPKQCHLAHRNCRRRSTVAPPTGEGRDTGTCRDIQQEGAEVMSSCRGAHLSSTTPPPWPPSMGRR
uniref:Uncharacterized protein n=1 Tax=Setaria italica TaxID=4555 RepID=K3ZK94_SETIT